MTIRRRMTIRRGDRRAAASGPYDGGSRATEADVLRATSDPIPFDAVDFAALEQRIAADAAPTLAERRRAAQRVAANGVTRWPIMPQRAMRRAWWEYTARWAGAVVPVSVAASLAIAAVVAFSGWFTIRDEMPTGLASLSSASPGELRAADIADSLLVSADATQVLSAVLTQ
jgi:hypothetical protein